MRNGLTLFCALALLVGCATAPIVQNAPYVRVIDAEGTKDVLYVKTMEWMTKSFRSAKSVIVYQDKEAGVVTGNGVLPPGNGYSLAGSVAFTIKIEVKDGKARITFDNIRNISTGTLTAGEYPVDPRYDTDSNREHNFGPLVSSFSAALSAQTSDF